ncbi:MAG TPA: hypothetical protein VHU21_26575 [Paraburkholderia sp.]|nr:hypothetical protein [Paraburkholderia sp.]
MNIKFSAVFAASVVLSAATLVAVALEEQLKETLFHRNTRRVQITTFGQSLVVNAQAALAGVDALSGSHPCATRQRASCASPRRRASVATTYSRS